jgi:hypothetical protein
MGPVFKGQELQEERLSSWTSGSLKIGPTGRPQNIGIELPINAAQYPKTEQISSTSRQKPEITQTFGGSLADMRRI